MKNNIILMSIFTALFVFMGVYINELNSYVYSVIGIVAGWSNLLISKQNMELKSENDGLKSENIILIQQQQKSLDEINVLRQKYSRTNKPRSGGRFVKKKQFLESVALDNVGISIKLENGVAGVVCGYNSSCTLTEDKSFIIGITEHDSRGWTFLDNQDIIFDGCEYPRYYYVEYQDILNAKRTNK